MGFLSLFHRRLDDESDRAFVWLTPSRWELGRTLPDQIARANSLADVVPFGSAKVAAQLNAEGKAWILVIDKSVPSELQDRSWENLRIGGALLETNAVVIRDATWPDSDANSSDASPKSCCGFLNLFPADEYDFAAQLEEQVVNQRMIHCYPRFAREGLDRFDELIIVAHGDEQGLLAPDETPFTIETEALPKRIWLLACNVNGAMFRLARELIARGVRSVITSTGELSAPEIASVVDEWLCAKEKFSPEEWIRMRRVSGRKHGGIRALTLHGEISIDNSAARDWNSRTWEFAAKQTAPKVGKSEEDFEQALLALERHDGDLWPITRDWMLVEALLHAENFDHQRMNALLPRVEGLEKTAAVQFAIANSNYRRGEYLRVAKRLVQGLSVASANSEDRVNLLGLLVNVLIDMNLPRSADAALLAEKKIELQDDALDRIYTFQCLDRVSRNAFRDGRIAEAREAMEAKRREAMADEIGFRNSGLVKHTSFGGIRELAWILYFRSWEDWETNCVSAEGMQAVGEVLDVLRTNVVEVRPEGNSPVGYLLRALACWLWVNHLRLSPEDRSAIFNAIQPWKAQIVDGCAELDPGPWAFARCYLALAGLMPTTDIVLGIRALERARYFSEAAAFAGLAAREDIQAPLLEQFVQIRAGVVSELLGLGEVLPGVVEGLSEAGSNLAPI